MHTPTQKKVVVIHGDDWQVDHIRKDVQTCRAKDGWTLKPWKNLPALVDKYHSQQYTGQELRTPSQRVEPEGWTHGHCAICWWTIHEGDDPASNCGYTYNDRRWVCVECFEQFVQPQRVPYDG